MNKQVKEHVVIDRRSIARCPSCGAGVYVSRGMMQICQVCTQALDWGNKVRKVKDSTELSGGHLW